MMQNTPKLTVDAVILLNGKIVLIKRKNPPYQNMFALPGGFVDIGETVEQAVAREAYEETGLEIEIIKMIGIYSDPLRDPRGHVISACYLVKGNGIPKARSDALDIGLFDIDNMPHLAFDHDLILEEIREEIYEILPRM
jgi:8-oxo-dGTP diphosphatase